MGSETADPVGDGVDVSTRSCPKRKVVGKAPRKVHKAVREKLKRDHMNELFLDLGKTVDLDQLNNGKAAVLKETIRLIAELVTQVDNLKKENVALLSESNYVIIEKNELLEETSALDAQIKMLQREMDEKANRSNLDLPQSQSITTPQLQEDHRAAFPLVGHASESTPIMAPVFVMPLHHESQGLPVPYPEVTTPMVQANVSRPRPRYPSSSDWSSHILNSKQIANMIEDS